jgi:hypothetical protein
MGATSGAGTAYTFGAPEFIHGFIRVRVARSLVFSVVFCRSLFVLLSLSFGHCIVVPSSIYGLVGFVFLDL